MKKIISLMLSAVLMMALFTACSSEEEAKVYTSEELATVVTTALGEEMAGYFPPITLGSEDLNSFLFNADGLGFDAANYQAGAFSFSIMNTQAYAVMLVQPAEGMEESALAELEEYRDYIISAFEGYLPDQLAVAQEGKVETLENGLIALVIYESGDDVLNAIKTELTAE